MVGEVSMREVLIIGGATGCKYRERKLLLWTFPWVEYKQNHSI